MDFLCVQFQFTTKQFFLLIKTEYYFYKNVSRET